MNVECKDARPLIPSYLDGELSEAQASPLRKHLMDCHECRAAAQGEKALSRWFVPAEAAPVPAGFAARVARRAFAGDTGSFSASDVASKDVAAQGKVLQFVLRMTAVAAVFLMVLAIAIRTQGLPSDNTLMADDSTLRSLDVIIKELEEREDRASAEDGKDQSLTRQRTESGDSGNADTGMRDR